MIQNESKQKQRKYYCKFSQSLLNQFSGVIIVIISAQYYTKIITILVIKTAII